MPTPKARLSHALKLLADTAIDALIIPSADPHLSEYLPAHWQGRAWLSGFTGSVGTLVITADFAGLWTDSRYWLQADKQLHDTGITLQKMQAGTAPPHEFLAAHLPAGARVAIDGAVLSVADFDEMLSSLSANNISLITDVDLLDKLWAERPAPSDAPIYVHDDKFIDVQAVDKLQQVREMMATHGADAHLISSLDDIAWLTNLRGSDVEYNPVFLAHFYLDAKRAVLFVDSAKLGLDAMGRLNAAGISIADYGQTADSVAGLLGDGRLLIDPARTAYGTVAAIDSQQIIRAMNPSILLKSIKTDAQIAHIRTAMRQDGIALCEFFADFEARLSAGEVLTELEVDSLLTRARSRQSHFISLSFDTIAGFNANGAVIHYKATPDSHSTICGDGLLLIDSGAQYQNGTTDITRMVGIGTVSDTQKWDVTQVMKAHIALAMAHFPAGLSSVKLDAIARAPMWAEGLDYGHGTGHGVGYFLNVHEGPQGISINAPVTPERIIKAGMVTTNEPGLYRTGKWGIRLENCMVSVPAASTEFGEFLKFEPLTLCPFDTRLLLPELLNPAEKDWLNAYHRQVHEALIDGLSGAAKDWLIARTQAI